MCHKELFYTLENTEQKTGKTFETQYQYEKLRTKIIKQNSM